MRILVVEDDYLQAHALGLDIAASGDEMVGPFSTVQEAMGHLHHAQGAILDVELRGETSFGLADRLGQRQVPFVFLTGHGAEMVPGRFARSRVYTKPSSGSLLVGGLRQQQLIRPPVPSDVELLDVVREMMMLARLQLPDDDAAERLVEGTLLRAIAETINQPLMDDARERLLAMMREEYRMRGRNLLH